MVLLPLVAEHVDLPLIAAGGICDARSAAAAVVLGAEGVQMGTRMLASRESAVHANFKEAIVAADDATFGYPEMEVGLLPAIHYTHLPRIVGRHVAFDLLFTGRAFDAAEAQRLGLVNAIVPEEDVPGNQQQYIQINADLAKKWPSITKRKDALPDADEWKDKTGKLDQLIR